MLLAAIIDHQKLPMKYLSNIAIFLMILLFGFKICAAQESNLISTKKFSGTFQSTNQRICLKQDGSFCIHKIKTNLDVITAECVDTIAIGKWELLNKYTVILKNNIDYNKIKYNIAYEKGAADDSFYIEVNLPDDKSFFKGKFTYAYFFPNGIGNFQTSNNHLVLPKNKINRGQNFTFTLNIKNEFPNCHPGKRCYQRIYFQIFELLFASTAKNHIIINIPSFNECFIEQLDLDNELMSIDANKNINWDGIEYKRISKSTK